jgi:hypothetical protein
LRKAAKELEDVLTKNEMEINSKRNEKDFPSLNSLLKQAYNLRSFNDCCAIINPLADLTTFDNNWYVVSLPDELLRWRITIPLKEYENEKKNSILSNYFRRWQMYYKSKKKKRKEFINSILHCTSCTKRLGLLGKNSLFRKFFREWKDKLQLNRFQKMKNIFLRWKKRTEDKMRLFKTLLFDFSVKPSKRNWRQIFSKRELYYLQRTSYGSGKDS